MTKYRIVHYDTDYRPFKIQVKYGFLWRWHDIELTLLNYDVGFNNFEDALDALINLRSLKQNKTKMKVINV